MAYSGKTNWTNNEIVEASDMNRIEQGILDVDADVVAHKEDGGLQSESAGLRFKTDQSGQAG